MALVCCVRNVPVLGPCLAPVTPGSHLVRLSPVCRESGLQGQARPRDPRANRPTSPAAAAGRSEPPSWEQHAGTRTEGGGDDEHQRERRVTGGAPVCRGGPGEQVRRAGPGSAPLLEGREKEATRVKRREVCRPTCAAPSGSGVNQSNLLTYHWPPGRMAVATKRHLCEQRSGAHSSLSRPRRRVASEGVRVRFWARDEPGTRIRSPVFTLRTSLETLPSAGCDKVSCGLDGAESTRVPGAALQVQSKNASVRGDLTCFLARDEGDGGATRPANRVLVTPAELAVPAGSCGLRARGGHRRATGLWLSSRVTVTRRLETQTSFAAGRRLSKVLPWVERHVPGCHRHTRVHAHPGPGGPDGGFRNPAQHLQEVVNKDSPTSPLTARPPGPCSSAPGSGGGWSSRPLAPPRGGAGGPAVRGSDPPTSCDTYGGQRPTWAARPDVRREEEGALAPPHTSGRPNLIHPSEGLLSGHKESPTFSSSSPPLVSDSGHSAAHMLRRHSPPPGQSIPGGLGAPEGLGSPACLRHLLPRCCSEGRGGLLFTPSAAGEPGADRGLTANSAPPPCPTYLPGLCLAPGHTRAESLGGGRKCRWRGGGAPAPLPLDVALRPPGEEGLGCSAAGSLRGTRTSGGRTRPSCTSGRPRTSKATVVCTAGGDRGAEALSGSLTFHHNRGERDAAPTARDHPSRSQERCAFSIRGREGRAQRPKGKRPCSGEGWPRRPQGPARSARLRGTRSAQECAPHGSVASGSPGGGDFFVTGEGHAAGRFVGSDQVSWDSQSVTGGLGAGRGRRAHVPRFSLPERVKRSRRAGSEWLTGIEILCSDATVKPLVHTASRPAKVSLAKEEGAQSFQTRPEQPPSKGFLPDPSSHAGGPVLFPPQWPPPPGAAWGGPSRPRLAGPRGHARLLAQFDLERAGASLFPGKALSWAALSVNRCVCGFIRGTTKAGRVRCSGAGTPPGPAAVGPPRRTASVFPLTERRRPEAPPGSAGERPTIEIPFDHGRPPQASGPAAPPSRRGGELGDRDQGIFRQESTASPCGPSLSVLAVLAPTPAPRTEPQALRGAHMSSRKGGKTCVGDTTVEEEEGRSQASGSEESKGGVAGGGLEGPTSHLPWTEGLPRDDPLLNQGGPGPSPPAAAPSSTPCQPVLVPRRLGWGRELAVITPPQDSLHEPAKGWPHTAFPVDGSELRASVGHDDTIRVVPCVPWHEDGDVGTHWLHRGKRKNGESCLTTRCVCLSPRAPRPSRTPCPGQQEKADVGLLQPTPFLSRDERPSTKEKPRATDSEVLHPNNASSQARSQGKTKRALCVWKPHTDTRFHVLRRLGRGPSQGGRPGTGSIVNPPQSWRQPRQPTGSQSTPGRHPRFWGMD
ncbi:hypothetical protein Cadr_000012982 [Camelus dromedarius]|uniref:Uncharacterized protein n=1 Tax=Camelus dromedarius TaxID=9838 RepID=A0A5N4D8V6_CAMDR|nr:hypothetical protein Cadr_000012982 [Camelus dromedarius]